jgi:putative iron-regulated protein
MGFAMTKRLKTWSAMGVAMVASGAMAQAGMPLTPSATMRPHYMLIDTAGGEGAEGGGESGSVGGTTYALDSTDPNAFKYDATAQIDAYIALVHESYELSYKDAKVLVAAVNTMFAKPSEVSLAAARKAWISARPAYLHTEAFRFYNGPIDAVEAEINAWPVNEAVIDYVEGNLKAGLVNDRKLKLSIGNLEAINKKKYDTDVTIGWHAVEFLLWGQDLSATGAGNRPYTDYIAGKNNNDRRRKYLKMATSQLAEEIEHVGDQWDVKRKSSFASKFKALPQREAVGRMINGMAVLAGHELKVEGLEAALASGSARQEQSQFSDTSKQDFLNSLQGIKRVWTETKLGSLMTLRNAGLADKITALIADAETKLAAVGQPWDQVLAAPPGSAERKSAEDATTSLRNLADGLKAAGNALGVLVLMPED